MTLHRKKKLAIVLMTVCLVSQTGFGPCNRQKTLASAAEAAKDITGATRDVIQAVAEAYQAKLITLEQKDELANILSAIAKGGRKGVEAIEFLHKQGVTDPSSEQRFDLTKIFDDDVIAPFLEFLVKIDKLSDNSSVAIRAAMASLRTAIVLLSSRIGRYDVIEQIKAREVAWNV